MDGETSLGLLLLSTATISVVHALAPDHWIPFVSIGRARKWSRPKLVWVTFLSSLGHIGSSVVLGCVGLTLGLGMKRLEAFESQRAEVAGILLIGFGLAYMVWGLKQVRRHRHPESNASITIWALIVLFVLGPCEPMIPLMFVSATKGWHAVLLVSGLFAVITILMMIGQVLMAEMGLSLIKFSRIEVFSHAIAGFSIALTGLLVIFLGI